MSDLLIFTLGSVVAGMVLTAVVVLEWAALTSTHSARSVPVPDPKEGTGVGMTGAKERHVS